MLDGSISLTETNTKILKIAEQENIFKQILPGGWKMHSSP